MRLIDCFIDLIAYTAFAMAGAKEKPLSFDQFKKDVDKLVEDSEMLRHRGGFSEEEYNEARFAVFAWVDEAVLCSSWPEREVWKRSELQLVHYQTTNAGEIFFERLDTLTPDADHQPMLEVYCTCLVMGFRGKYFSIRDTFDLEEKVRESMAKLRRGEDDDFSSKETRFFAQGYLDPSEKARKRFQLGVAPFAIGLVASAAFVVSVVFLLANASLNDLPSYISLTSLLR